MKPAAKIFEQDLAKIDFVTPEIPVVNNVDATRYTDAGSIRDGLSRQLYSPVRWVDSIQQIITGGATTIIECGPGKVLTGLVKRIDRSITGVCIDSADSIEVAIENVRSSN